MRESNPHKIEVHVAGLCFDGDKILIGQRAPDRRIYPSLRECGGGQVHTGENFEESIERQMREELNVKVEILGPVRSYEILTPNDQQKKIPGIIFACKFLGYASEDGVKLSEEMVQYRRQDVTNLKGIDFIPGVEDDIKIAYALYVSLLNGSELGKKRILT